MNLSRYLLPILLVFCVIVGSHVKGEYDRLVTGYEATKQRVDQLIDESKKVAESVNRVLDSIQRIKALEEQVK
jgi:hypothetical protein